MKTVIGLMCAIALCLFAFPDTAKAQCYGGAAGASFRFSTGFGYNYTPVVPSVRFVTRTYSVAPAAVDVTPVAPTPVPATTTYVQPQAVIVENDVISNPLIISNGYGFHYNTFFGNQAFVGRGQFRGGFGFRGVGGGGANVQRGILNANIGSGGGGGNVQRGLLNLNLFSR